MEALGLPSVPDLADHPALKRREIRLADGQVLRAPLQPGRVAPVTPPDVPGLGQHTEAVAREFRDAG